MQCDYEAIFINLGSTTGDSDGKTYDANVNAYITTGVGGTAMSVACWSATESVGGSKSWIFGSLGWNSGSSQGTPPAFSGQSSAFKKITVTGL